MTEYFSHFTNAEIGASPTGVMIINAVLVLLLVTCAVTDAREGKIYNKFTFPAMGIGLLLNGIFAGWPGLVWALIGWAIGMAIQWVPFMLGLAKAGDVKLLAAVGALKGWAFCGFGFLYGAAAFGIMIIPWLAMRGELKGAGQNIARYFSLAALTQKAPDAPTPTVEKKFVPWGVGLATGFFIALVLEVLLGRPTWIAF